MKNLAPDPFLIAYGNKYVELKITKDTISMYRDSFLEKKKILEEEKRELEKLNYQVWSLEDSLCEQIWRFSHEHDFAVIFQYHPFLTNCAKPRSNCKDDTKKSSELIDLINEIDAIKAEMIDLNQGKNIKREVESALTKLRKLQLISDDVTELLKLICSSQSSYKLETISMPIYDEIISNNGNKVKRRKNGSDCAKQMKNDRSNFMPKKKLVFTIPKNYPELSLERSIIFTANTIITNTSIESISNKKSKNFTLKKRSEISIKFQQYHKHKY
ncbi:PREDICTED: uncharacterized protein LOC108752821 [Trachymyrmex septentrionalis]|uniref:uncharacterized protein LOC108752821 n=1 Tax=Trachymyrmex septentrionalis TaxID=34720 RepID=UPI00084F2B70|nr:PREDICTED: uncharacterized protein LOC108752821 [Trachymyrmex septentrionalis]